MSSLSRIVSTGMIFASVAAYADVFDSQVLPSGKNVTLSRQTQLMIPLKQRVSISSTDLPQSLKFTNTGAVEAFRLAIYDKNAKRIQRVELKPNSPFVYHFANLGSVQIEPEQLVPGSTLNPNQKLMIQSDKPLELSK